MMSGTTEHYMKTRVLSESSPAQDSCDFHELYMKCTNSSVQVAGGFWLVQARGSIDEDWDSTLRSFRSLLII